MKRSSARAVAPMLALCAAIACSRASRAGKPLEPLRGDSVWLTDGVGRAEAGIEETLSRFGCAAVFLPARSLAASPAGWAGQDRPPPARPLSRVPVVLVLESSEDPLAGAEEKAGKEFGRILAREIAAVLSRASAFGPVRGVHLDIPFSASTAAAHAAALTEARSRLSHLLSREGDPVTRLAREVPVTVSMRRPPPTEEKEQEAVRALASRSDGLVAFVFGDDNSADPAFIDSLGKAWWAGYASATTGLVRKKSGESGLPVPESALDALTDDPRTELLHGVPWDEERGLEFTLRATQNLSSPGVALSPGDSVVFAAPSLADMLGRFRSDTSGRRFARGHVVVFAGGAESDRLFPISALADVLTGRLAVPDLNAWTAAEGSRLLRVAAENRSPHASAVSRIENWVEVDLAPARVGDVEVGGFDRWEAYDENGRPVSPGRATRVRLYETLVAPLERFEPARLRVRGKLPAPCCRLRIHLRPAAGGEIATAWALPGAAAPGANPSPSP
ncbi:MAG TPA: hypothetical protein VGB47_04695 [Thermoanaerobaculia bacterium]